jgi:hypothetical protein
MPEKLRFNCPSVVTMWEDEEFSVGSICRFKWFTQAKDLSKAVTITITAESGSFLVTNTSEIEGNKFTVFGENGKFFWIVHGKRCSIDVEPDKSTTVVKGTGPYKWI